MISVCMATYNGEQFIKEQLDSILCQLSEDDEIIISDDGSSDKTLEIIDSYNDRRIKVYHHEKDKSLLKINKLRNFYYTTQNFENALKNAKGDYIFLADQDDVWHPKRKELVLECLKQNNLVMCNYSIIDTNGMIVEEKFYKHNPISKNRLINVLKSKYLGCCMAFSKSVLEKSLPFPKKLLAHDYWIGCLSKSCFFLDTPLHLYRRHGTNVSSSSGKSTNSILTKIMYRFMFVIKLYDRLLKIWSR